MARFLSLLAVAVLTRPVLAAPASVADLVRQLGDPKFAVREAAQKDLLTRGEEIVPELDRLTKGVDAETAERLRKVRYELVGYQADIQRLLQEVDNRFDSVSNPISPELRGLITRHQPRAGDLLLDQATDAYSVLGRRARRAFLQTWESASAAQIDRLIRQQVSLTANHRPKFPAKVGALIPVEAQIHEDWGGWFPIDGERRFKMEARTTRYLDGKPYDKPFVSPHPFGTVGWYRVGELAEGRHTIHAVLEYEFTHRGEKRTGTIRCKDSTFEVIPADTPDDLVAPKSAALTKQVRSKFLILEAGPDLKFLSYRGYHLGPPPADWSPQVTWDVKPGVRAGLHCPVVENAPLDVDLCFDAEIHDVKSGTVYPADPVVVRAGEARRNWVMPRDVRAFAQRRDGFVTVKIVLKPSRALALTNLDIKRYYPEPITSDEMRMKVYQKVEVRP